MAELTYEPMRIEWATDLAGIEAAAFPTIDPVDLLQVEDIARMCEVYPEGGVVTLDEGRPVAFGVGIFIDFDFDDPHHSLDDLIGELSCGNHDPDGDWYYGITIATLPEYRKRGIGRGLYEWRKRIVTDHDKAGIVAGGVIPGYREYLGSMSADEYIDKVVAGELYDATLSFQLENGFRAMGAIPNYLSDPSVGDNAVLIVWDNPERPG